MRAGTPLQRSPFRTAHQATLNTLLGHRLQAGTTAVRGRQAPNAGGGTEEAGPNSGGAHRTSEVRPNFYKSSAGWKLALGEQLAEWMGFRVGVEWPQAWCERVWAAGERVREGSEVASLVTRGLILAAPAVCRPGSLWAVPAAHPACSVTDTHLCTHGPSTLSSPCSHHSPHARQPELSASFRLSGPVESRNKEITVSS